MFAFGGYGECECRSSSVKTKKVVETRCIDTGYSIITPQLVEFCEHCCTIPKQPGFKEPDGVTWCTSCAETLGEYVEVSANAGVL